MVDAAVVIIGGGVVGLALAAELSQTFSPLYLLERNAKYGLETSSRNSEVIHAGLYYPRGSLKARLCVEGNRRLYELCRSTGIPHRRTGKIITATCTEELEVLEILLARGKDNGVQLEMLDARQVHVLEPEITTVGGIFSPSTGIISAHALMDHYFHVARRQGAEVQTRCTVTGVSRISGGYRLIIEEDGAQSTVTAEAVINASGLESDLIAAMAGIDIERERYRLQWCKGSYFALPPSLSQCVSHLVYPVPSRDTLGVHAVLDLGGRLKFGPDMEYLGSRSADYRVQEAKRHAFAESVRKILPKIRDEDLSPDMSGIRPKLAAHGDKQRDFIIREESEKGLPGFINLVGIDSPGLTAAPAIASTVAALLGR